MRHTLESELAKLEQEWLLIIESIAEISNVGGK